MTKKSIVLCLLIASVFLFVSQTLPKKALSIKVQVNQALGGKVIRVEPNNSLPEDSLVQRVTLVVDKNGVQSRAYMEYTIDENLNILQRRLFGSNNSVLWSAAAVAMSPEERANRWGDCIEECKRDARRLPRRNRARIYAMCASACDLFYDPAYGPPLEAIK
jgi:hypothetical protein